MLIANDSNYTFGQFLAVEEGDDIKAPVYSKCFTDTEALKGYRFIHDPEESDPEMCVCFSIYNETSSAALSTPFKEFASVSDLTSVMFRLDTEIVEGVLREVPYYHVIVPVLNIVEEAVEYLVIKMTKEVELFPENYPYYELVDTFEDAEPISAEAPGGGGITPTGTIQITENDTYDVTNYASAEVNVSGGSSVFTSAVINIACKAGQEGELITVKIPCAVNDEGEEGFALYRITIQQGESLDFTIPLYEGFAYLGWNDIVVDAAEVLPVVSGDVIFNTQAGVFEITGAGTITLTGVSQL